MQPAALITFVLVALFVWGGLAFIVVTALRRESAKAVVDVSEAQAPPAPPTGGVYPKEQLPGRGES